CCLHQAFTFSSRDPHRLASFFPYFRSLKPFRPCVVPTFLHPWRHGSIQSRSSGHIVVHVGGNVQTTCPRRIHFGHHSIQLVPIFLSALFQVIDFCPDFCFISNTDKFVQTLQ